MCLSYAKLPTTSSELKKLKSKKLWTILNQVSALENSKQTISITHNDFQPLVSIISEKLDNTK